MECFEKYSLLYYDFIINILYHFIVHYNIIYMYMVLNIKYQRQQTAFFDASNSLQAMCDSGSPVQLLAH